VQGYGQLPGHQTNVNQELLREQEPKVRKSAVEQKPAFRHFLIGMNTVLVIMSAS